MKLFQENRVGIGILLITWIAFFSPILFNSQVYFDDDLEIIYYPLEYEYAQFQQAGELPQWSNTFGFGHPLLSWGQLGFFTPIHLLLRAFSLHPLVLLQASILIYFGIGLAGMYALLRAKGLSQLAGALGAIIFTFNGFMVGHMLHVNFYVSTMVLPLMLLAIHYFLQQPSLKRSVYMAAAVAVIVLSGQPQIALYTVLIAALYGVINFLFRITNRKLLTTHYKLQTIGYSALAAVIALGLSSFAILPLLEFIPITERQGDLPVSELLEFSYIPTHAITLLFPYFFNSHESYWGTKSFVELAAHIGVIPLLLAGAGLVSWNKFRTLRAAGAALAIIGFGFALGEHSPLYRWLIEEHIITSLNIPGRFMFFFTTGIALLAATGLDTIIFHYKRLSSGQKLAAFGAGMVLAAAPAIPAFLAAVENVRFAVRMEQVLDFSYPAAALFFLGTVLFIPFLFIPQDNWRRLVAASLVIVTAGTLVVLGVPFNETENKDKVFARSAITEAVRAETDRSTIPPRLYSRPELLRQFTASDKPLVSEQISPIFAVHQPIDRKDLDGCIKIPMQADRESAGQVQVSLRKGPAAEPIETLLVYAPELRQHSRFTACFSPIPEDMEGLVVSFESVSPSGIKLLYTALPPEEVSAYFVRVQNPDPEEVEKSQKTARVRLITEPSSTAEEDVALLTRHLQVTAGASSARWIGALSIRSYREFIESFYANDVEEVIGGDGLHVLERNRTFFNMGSITHFIQRLPFGSEDRMANSGFEIAAEEEIENDLVRLYRNPAAYPKAYLVPAGKFSPAADETRFQMLQDDFNPLAIAYISGPTPPEVLPDAPFDGFTGSAEIVQYQQTRVDIKTQSDRPAVLVVSDSTSPEWQTFIDNEPALQLAANSIFKAAIVPAGQHTVSFQYISPAVERAKLLSIIALIAAGACLLPWRGFRRSGSATG